MLNNLLFSVCLMGLLLFGCQSNQETFSIVEPDKSLVRNQIRPHALGPKQNKLVLSDFIPEYDEVDSILLDGRSIPFDSFVYLDFQPQMPLGLIEIYVNRSRYCIPVRKSTKKPVTYVLDERELQLKNPAKEILIKGEMNAWNPNNGLLVKNKNNWSIDFLLDPGKYQYSLIVDGKEMLDRSNNLSIDHGLGGQNSVLQVPGEENVIRLDAELSIHNDSFQIVSPEAEQCIVLLNNQRIEAEKKDDGFSLFIPNNVRFQGRSHIRIWLQNKDHISQEFLIPLKDGHPITDAKDLSRHDMHQAVMYNIFIDRFHNGDTLNDLANPEVDIHPRANHHGGDIIGARKILESKYFDSLGVNTLWISPVVKNTRGAYGRYPTPNTRFSAYHGYWPVSFTEVDERLTTESDLQEFVDIAHESNKNVLLDFIANHVHEEHPFYVENPDIATDLYLEDGTMNTEKWDEHRLTTWFDTFMPSLDLSRPEISEMLSDSALFWMDKYDFDGFRHDATKHVPNNFWRDLTRKLKARSSSTNEPMLYQIGETYGTPELIASYLGSGLLDAQFDFNLYDAMVASLAGKLSMKRLRSEIERSLKYYGAHHLMGNITGNQDRARFISFAAGDLSLNEDSKYAGWNRNIGIKDPIKAYQKQALLFGLISTLPGIPVIFYGDEIGIPGGNDPDNRKMMKFTDWNEHEEKLLTQTRKLLNFRRNSMPLNYGNTSIVLADEDILIYKRKYLDNSVLIVINNGEIPIRNLGVRGEYKKTLMGHDRPYFAKQQMINLPPNSFEIYYN